MAADLPDRARVVVIGGGAIGLSTLYHLAEIGISDAVLLERWELTCGTTWHSAAQVRTLRSTRNLTRLIKYSAELYARIEAETGQATGWTRTGSLSIATNPDRFTHIKRQAALSELFDIECHVIGAEEAGERRLGGTREEKRCGMCIAITANRRLQRVGDASWHVGAQDAPGGAHAAEKSRLEDQACTLVALR